MDIAKNFAKVTVTDGNYDASSTSIDLITGHGARLPAVPFNAVWWNATDYPDPSDDPGVEIVRVTNVTSDTLTITRAQEGTAANDKNVAGKTYKMIAGMTARTINEDLLGDVHGSGLALLVQPIDNRIRIRGSATCFLDVASSGDVSVQAAGVTIGDVEGEGNFTTLTLNDSTQLITLSGKVGTNQSASASTSVGTLVAKLPIYNESGTLLGYIPIYSTIT